MLKIKTILHGTDFSERSANALALACALTRDYGARLVVLHVAHTPIIYAAESMPMDSIEDYRAEAQSLLNRLEVPVSDVRVERRLEDGDPATEILRVAAELSADLVVLGVHGRTGLGRLLMGSVAEYVVRYSPSPVVTVTKPFAPAIPHEKSED